MPVTFPNESAEYRVARDLLLDKEKELRRLTEDVAVARRALPPGGEVPEDYVFQGVRVDGAVGDVRLSDLFEGDKRSLFVYSFMFGLEMEAPCPSCSAFLDGLDGAVKHATQRVNVAVVARSPLPRILAAAEERGWRHIRFLSSADNTYNRDYFGETEDGDQLPMHNVFYRDDDAIRHASGAELMFAEAEPGQDSRHSDSVDIPYNLFDFTPDGRGDFNPQLSYHSEPAGTSPACH